MQNLFDLEDEPFVFIRGSPVLTPAQANIAAQLTAGIAAADVNLLRVAPGMGRTTILRSVHAQTGGAFLAKPVSNIEALKQGEIVFVDDLHLLPPTAHAAISTLVDDAEASGTKFVLAASGENELPAVSQRAAVWEMENFAPADYAAIAEYYLGNEAARLDMTRVHNFAPALTVDQLKNACLWLGLREATPDTDSMVQYLRRGF